MFLCSMRFLKGCYKDISIGQRIVLLAAMILFFSSISLIAAKLLQGEYSSIATTPVENLLLRQTLDTIAFFILPLLVYLYLRGKSLKKWVFGSQQLDPTVFVLIGLMMLVSIPIVQALAAFNAAIPFPESWQLAIEMEAEINNVLNRFFESDSTLVAIWLFFAIAILAPIGEEFLFRGLLIRFFNTSGWSAFSSVTVSAFIFSLLHMQMLGFIPRFLLGILLGYLFYRSGALLYSIWAHFMYNGLAYMLHIYESGNDVPEQLASAVSGESVIVLTLCSILLLLFVFLFIKRVSKKRILPLS